jgi:hypothetical protein
MTVRHVSADSTGHAFAALDERREQERRQPQPTGATETVQ